MQHTSATTFFSFVCYAVQKFSELLLDLQTIINRKAKDQ